MNDCVLCQEPGGQPIWQGEKLRLIRADEAGFPAFYRIVWNTHVAEFSDLSAAQRHGLHAVLALGGAEVGELGHMRVPDNAVEGRKARLVSTNQPQFFALPDGLAARFLA